MPRPSRPITPLALLPLSAAAQVAVALLLAGAAGCGRSASPQAGAAPPVEPFAVDLVAVEWRDAARMVEVTGTLHGTEEATISAEVPGRVESLRCDIGDLVPEDGILAQLERIQYQLALDQRRASMLETLATLGLAELPTHEFDGSDVPTVVKAQREAANAEARFRRAEQLWTQQPPLISEQDYSDLATARDVRRSEADVALLEARAALAAARSRAVEIALAEERLDDTTIRAPRLGGPGPSPEADPAADLTPDPTADPAADQTADPTLTAPGGAAPTVPTYAVAARFVSVGEFVAAGTPMLRLVAADPIKFRGDVPERFVGQLQVGQPAELRVDAFEEAFIGRVRRVNPQIAERSRTFQVEVEVPNPALRLRPGAFGRATIVTGADAGVPFVPAEAVVTFAGLSKVFAVVDGKAVEHRVVPGRRVGGHIEAIGLPAGVESVVATGARRLATGVPVAPAPTSPSSAPGPSPTSGGAGSPARQDPSPPPRPSPPPAG